MKNMKKIFEAKVKRQKASGNVVSGQRSVVGILVGALFLLFTVHCALTTVQAQSGGIFSIMQATIAGGGAQNVTAGIFSLDNTLGQPVAGDMASGPPYDIAPGFWPGIAPVIGGTVSYGNVLSGPPRFISNVLISGDGTNMVSVLTGFPDGTYALSGFGSGSYTVTPTKVGGVNGAISSFDAGRIALHVAGPPNPQLTATQLLVADVSGNGVVTSFDAGMIAKFVAGPPYSAPGIGATGTWRFSPLNRTYASVGSNIIGEDYVGLLMGDVSGNWTNTAVRPLTSNK